MNISRSIGLAHTSVKKNLDTLVKMGLITESLEKKGGRNFPIYAANTESKIFTRYKKIHNLRAVLESGLADFIEDKLSPKCIVLFGSYERGEDVEGSDMDIFVECRKEELDVSMFEKKLHRKVQMHFSKNFDSFPDELKNNIINGAVLKGFLEVYK